MNAGREQLHDLVDAMPEEALDRAEQALKYCINPLEKQRSIEQVKRHVRERMRQNLKKYGERIGRGMISDVGSELGFTMPDGDFRSSMSGWDDGPVTYHLRGFNGHVFEIYERLELDHDGNKLVLTQRIVAPNGTEQLVTTNLPIAASPS